MAPLHAQHAASAQTIPLQTKTDAVASSPDLRSAYAKAAQRILQRASGHTARNINQDWSTRFDGRGCWISPAHGDWTWGLELQAFGFTSNPRQEFPLPKVSSSGNQLNYAWGPGLTEWYINGDSGLEHGFSVGERPDQHGDPDGQALELKLGVRGSLVPEETPDKLSLEFYDTDGLLALKYSGLKVYDASGQDLPASLLVREGQVLIRIDEHSAQYPITIDPVVHQAFLKASNTGSFDRFGTSIAISGKRAVVGAPGEDSSATGVDGDQGNDNDPIAGAAYVFLKTSTGWIQEAYLKAFVPGVTRSFGLQVTIDGDRIFVAAQNKTFASSDVVFEFVRSSTGWRTGKALVPQVTSPSTGFGCCLALSGSLLVVGAKFESSNATGINGDATNQLAPLSGAAYVFTRSGARWTQEAYLKASNTSAGDFFGTSVDIEGDTVVIGASLEDGDAQAPGGPDNNDNRSDSGAAYVFVRTAGVWHQESYLKASNAGQGDAFGRGVSIAGDTIAVGSPNEDSAAQGIDGDQLSERARDAGAVYTFTRAAGLWTQEAYIKASNTRMVLGTDAFFGHDVAIDGDRLLVAAPDEVSPSYGIDGVQTRRTDPTVPTGAVYALVRSQGKWRHQAFLKGPTLEVDGFGSAIALSGSLAIVGAPSEDSNALGVNGNMQNNREQDSGAVMVTELNAPTGMKRYGNYVGANQADLYSFSDPAALATIQLELTDFAGSGSAMIFLSSGIAKLPALGGTILLDLSSLALAPSMIPITAGAGSLSVRIPQAATGMSFFAQCAMPDASQPAGLLFSNGLRIQVKP